MLANRKQANFFGQMEDEILKKNCIQSKFVREKFVFVDERRPQLFVHGRQLNFFIITRQPQSNLTSPA